MEPELHKVSITKIIRNQDAEFRKDFELILNMGFSDTVEILLLPSTVRPDYAFSDAQITMCRAFIGKLVDAYFRGELEGIFSYCLHEQCDDNNSYYPVLSDLVSLRQNDDILFRIADWIEDVVHSIQVLSGGISKSILYYSRGDSDIIRKELARIGRIKPHVRAISWFISFMKKCKKILCPKKSMRRARVE